MEHLALDKNDNVYVTDPQPDPGCSMKPRVLKFDSNDVFITKFAVFGNKLDQSSDPEHLAETMKEMCTYQIEKTTACKNFRLIKMVSFVLFSAVIVPISIAFDLLATLYGY